MVSMASAILGPRRHGLTPIAVGWHSEMEHHEFRLDKDVEYVRRRSLAMDLWILLLTPWTVLRSGGIYPEAAEQRRA